MILFVIVVSVYVFKQSKDYWPNKINRIEKKYRLKIDDEKIVSKPELEDIKRLINDIKESNLDTNLEE